MVGPTRILVGGSTLFSDRGPVPRPLAKSRLALDRLRELGEPVVLVGRDLGGRRLPDDEDDRVAWVRDCLGIPWLTIVAFEEPDAGRPMAPTTKQADGSWGALRATWRGVALLTTFESTVGAARRAGLNVIRIGARGSGTDPTHPRADYEAIDLLDAVRHLMFADAFDDRVADLRTLGDLSGLVAAAGGSGPVAFSGGSAALAISGGSGPVAAAHPDMFKGR
jgi:hypothetical protein